MDTIPLKAAEKCENKGLLALDISRCIYLRQLGLIKDEKLWIHLHAELPMNVHLTQNATQTTNEL